MFEFSISALLIFHLFKIICMFEINFEVDFFYCKSQNIFYFFKNFKLKPIFIKRNFFGFFLVSKSPNRKILPSHNIFKQDVRYHLIIKISYTNFISLFISNWKNSTTRRFLRRLVILQFSCSCKTKLESRNPS